MSWIRYLFYIAGGYGMLVLLPQYFLEERMGLDYPPPITHPEYFYGFIGVTLAWQVAYLIVASDPPRFRPIIAAGACGKLSFFIAAVVLFGKDRTPGTTVLFACVDLVLVLLFAVAWWQLGRQTAAYGRNI